MAGSLAEFTAGNFDAEVLGATGPVLVDFSSNGCGPCRKLAPVLEELSRVNAGAATIGKLDVSDHPSIAARYQISLLPTLILFRDGQPRAVLLGLKSRDEIQKLIDAWRPIE